MIIQHLQERRLKIEGRIGFAYESFGAAYTGMRDDIGRKVAIKIVALHSMTEDEVDDLRQEAYVLRLLDHEFIIGPAEYFVKSSLLYCVTNLMDLGSVRRILNLPDYSHGIPENTIAAIVKQLAEALEYVHTCGIVHRGIRCSHILCSSTGQIKLGGFRYAIHLKEGNDWMEEGKLNKTYTYTPKLTSQHYWCAPEILNQDLNGYDYKSDIYSVGISICEMANGIIPFADMDNRLQILFEKHRGIAPLVLDCTSVNPDVSPADTVFCKKRFSKYLHILAKSCLSQDQRERPTATQVKRHEFVKEFLGRRLSKKVSFQNNWPLAKPLMPALQAPDVEVFDEVIERGELHADTDLAPEIAPWLF